jgi:peptide/nickel transport system permease protein
MSQTTAIDAALGEGAQRRPSFYVEVLQRLVREKPLGLIGAIIVLIFIVMAVATQLVAPGDPNALGSASSDRLLSPSWSHPFGTDNLARDVFTRVVYGARVSITIGLLAVAISAVISVFMGVLSAYFGGWIDLLFQRLVDAFIAIPGLVLIVAIVAMFGNSDIPGLPETGLFSTEVVLLIITLGVLFGVSNSRVIRGSALAVMGTTYIDAARSIGASDGRMIMVHILPNVMAPVITLATLGLGGVILVEASLSFLGMGVPADVPTWGGMLNREARTWMSQGYWWLAVAPGVALSLVVFSFNMLGDALRDLLDPQMRGSR